MYSTYSPWKFHAVLGGDKVAAWLWYFRCSRFIHILVKGHMFLWRLVLAGSTMQLVLWRWYCLAGTNKLTIQRQVSSETLAPTAPRCGFPRTPHRQQHPMKVWKDNEEMLTRDNKVPRLDNYEYLILGKSCQLWTGWSDNCNCNYLEALIESFTSRFFFKSKLTLAFI